MNTERTVILENVGDCPIGLADTQRRMYRLAKGAKMRISAVTLQDILDHPGSKAIFKSGRAKVSNITEAELYAMGLNSEEISLFLLKDKKPAVVITEDIKEEKEEIIEIDTPVEEPIEVKKPTPKKNTVKKATSKKTK